MFLYLLIILFKILPMNDNARTWFDSAYSLLGEFSIPFGFITSKYKRSDLKQLVCGRSDVKLVEKEINYFKKSMPKEQDFLEEKERLLNYLVPDLSKALIFVNTAFYFGSVRGDIDIGLINPGITDENLDNNLIGLRSKYPLVDWNCLYHFKSETGKEFVNKLAYEIIDKCILVGADNLIIDSFVRPYILNAKLLWGNPEELEFMKNYVSSYN
ncbi:Uncharacterised protein [Candidatus Tiddalikarchaeum anstoanum]|nr:Uncharacterised protein [Candidatus Tiddalikarchaeum anstoanum]